MWQGHLPFAVVGSTEEVCVGNKMVKARQYPWGVVQGRTGMWPHKYDICLHVWLPNSHSCVWRAHTESVENENHCDFVKLREMLICVNMEDLREQTHTRHYELYRRCKLEEMGFKDTGPECKPVRSAAQYTVSCVTVSSNGNAIFWNFLIGFDFIKWSGDHKPYFYPTGFYENYVSFLFFHVTIKNINAFFN